MNASKCSGCGDAMLDDDSLTTICRLCKLKETAKEIWYIIDKKKVVFAYADSYEKAMKDFANIDSMLYSLSVDAFIALVRKQYPR